MNRNTWRSLASAFLAATLSLGIAACDDDTSSGTGDMGVSADMSASADMSGMMGMPGNGQLTLADVVGTVFSPTQGPLPRTHTLVAVASLPKIAGTPDPSSNFGVTPTIHGCSIYRYNAQNLPGADGDAGDVTFSGFNTDTTIGFNVNGSFSASPMSGSSPITCKRGATDMLYHCAYAGSFSPDSGEAGSDVGSVIYPLIQHRAFCAGDPTVTIPVPGFTDQWPYGQGNCNERVVKAMTSVACTGQGNMLLFSACEQDPIKPFGESQIVETVAGGTDWPMAMDTLGNGGGLDGGVNQLAGPLYIVKVESGSTDITGHDAVTGGNNLDILDTKIDATQDLTITFSCDPNNATTAGAGCAGSQDLVGLLVTTSTSPKTAFSVSTATGQGTCSQSLSAGGNSITVKANQLTALLGGQTGGSWQIALVRLTTHLKSPAGMHPLLAFTAGMGVFGFSNQ